MLKFASPSPLPNLGCMNPSGTSKFNLIGEDDEIRIPNSSAFYRSPYGRVRCKKVSTHPTIITECNRKELPVISSDLNKSDKSSTGSSEGSDTHSDISSTNSSGLRGILTKRSENAPEKKSVKRVKFHEQLENVRELKDDSCKTFKMKPHPHGKKMKENTHNKLSYRATVSDSDLFRKRKQHYDVDRHSLSCSDIDSMSIENISPSSFVSTNGSTFSEYAKQVRTLFKSPLRHSYQQQPKSDAFSPKQSDQRNAKLRPAVGNRPESVLSIYSPKIIQDSSGQKFVVCRFAVPNDDISLSSVPSHCDNILRRKQGLKPILPEHLASIEICSTKFCNRDKSTRIMRWLDNVDDVHTKEGRYAELLDTVFHADRNG